MEIKDFTGKTGEVCPFHLTNYQWKEPVFDEQSNCIRLLVPHGDPNEHEFAIDFVFNSPDEAKCMLVEWELDEEAKENNWVLVKVTTEIIF